MGTGEGSHDNSKQKKWLASEYHTVLICRWGQSEQQDMYGQCDDDYVGCFGLRVDSGGGGEKKGLSRRYKEKLHYSST